jgi:glycerate 2-kinase
MSNKTMLNRVFNQLLEEIKPQKLIADACKLDDSKLTVLGQEYDLENYKNIYLLGSGKAAVPMAQEVEKILKPYLHKTLIIGPYSFEGTFHKGTYIQSTHPLPSMKSIDAAKSLQDMLQQMDEDDLFIYLLSGGNSALVELLEGDISLNELQEVTKLMLHSGMPIEKMNSVRKHLSRVKGGKLAEQTKAKGVVLVLSDVVGDDLYTIGSGPFYCDKTTFSDAEDALMTYGVFEKIPESIQTFLKEGKTGLHPETPKRPHEHIDHHILGSNGIVLEKARQLLQKEGIGTTIIDEPLQGDTKLIAKKLLKFAHEHQESTHAYIFGGETTVVVKGNGKGGRNQHLCLNMLTQCDIGCDITFLSAATDGVDGNSDAAGALIDIHSLFDAKARHIDPQHYLDSFDSNSFFEQSGELLMPGPTHNNLLDIVIMLIEPNPTERETNG